MKEKGNRRKNDLSLILGILGGVLFFFVMHTFGDPYDFVHRIDVLNLIPPIWLWKVTMTLWGFLLGYASGKTIFDVSSGGCPVEKKICAYRGGLFFISAFFLSLCHYPLLFIAEKLFIALLTVILSAVLAFFCGVSWAKVSKIASLIAFAFSFWLIYVIFVNAGVLLRI